MIVNLDYLIHTKEPVQAINETTNGEFEITLPRADGKVGNDICYISREVMQDIFSEWLEAKRKKAKK